jgi:hypothetical protein
MRRALTFACLLALAACASPAAQPPPTGSTSSPVAYPPGASDLVFEVAEIGGAEHSEGGRFEVPRLSVYGGGLVVIGGRFAVAIPVPQERQLTKAGLDRLMQAVVDAGVGPGSHTDHGTPRYFPESSMSSVRITVITTGGRTTTTLQGSGFKGDAAGVGPGQGAARDQVQKLLATTLRNLDWLGPEISGREGYLPPYKYTAMAVIAAPRAITVPPYELGDVPGMTRLPVPETHPWPLTDLDRFGDRLGDERCAVLTGAQLDQVREAAKYVTNTDLRWISGGSPYIVTFRPLLPHENGCSSLISAQS